MSHNSIEEERGDSRRHQTWAEPVGDEWEVTCSCDWESTGYEEQDDADAAGDEHVRMEKQ